MLDMLIYELNIEFIVYRPHNLPHADSAVHQELIIYFFYLRIIILVSLSQSLNINNLISSNQTEKWQFWMGTSWEHPWPQTMYRHSVWWMSFSDIDIGGHLTLWPLGDHRPGTDWGTTLPRCDNWPQCHWWARVMIMSWWWVDTGHTDTGHMTTW